MATLKDVAKLANVDVSTVSRALNNTSYVHPDTKAKIYAAVKALGYHPNVMARALRQGKRHTIGVLLPRLNFTIFAEVAQGIELQARKQGYATLICNTEDDPDMEKECLDRLRNGFVDGIIIAGTGKNKRLIRDLQADGTRIVQMIRKSDKDISSVVADYEAGTYEAVQFLAKRGCRKIGLINGSSDIIPYQARLAGYSKALQELGLPEYLAKGTPPCNTFSYGYECAAKLLQATPDMDAILAAVDVQGMAVLRLMRERGISVPDDMKIISLTGHSVGGMLETTMTSVEIPAKEMGIRLAKLLIESIEAPNQEKPSVQHIVYQTSLVQRETT